MSEDSLSDIWSQIIVSTRDRDSSSDKNVKISENFYGKITMYLDNSISIKILKEDFIVYEDTNEMNIKKLYNFSSDLGIL